MKLLLVYGAGSGLGKSTLVRAAARLLASHGTTCRVVPEEAAPGGHFAPYAARCAEGAGDDTAVLLNCALAFAEECRCFDGITIVDSILPCWDWLESAGCAPERIEAFTRQLASALTDLAPGMLLVGGDVARALERAMAERGKGWARRLARLRCQSEDPSDLLAYFTRLRSLTDDMLPVWPFPRLVLDTMRAPADSERALGDWLCL